MASAADTAEIALGTAVLRPETCEIAWAGGVEAIEPQVMRVLAALAREPGRVVTRDRLVELCWDGRSVSEDAINRVMSRIRRLSETTGAFQLSTQRKVGYRIDVVADGAMAASPQMSVVRRPAPKVAVAGLIVLLVATGAGLWLWRVQAQTPTQTPTPTLVVAALTDTDPSDHGALAARLGGQLTATLSRMHGLRLIDTPQPNAPAPNLLLDGLIDHRDGQPVVTLTLHDERSHQRLWSAVFDGRATVDPTVEERAASAPARYLAIWLGDRLSGQPTVHEPENPDVGRLVAEARRTLKAADDARNQRQWPLFAQLTARADALSQQAVALDPRSGQALILRQAVLAGGDAFRPGETPAAFHARMQQAHETLARALAADPDDPQVLVAAAHESTGDMRWDDASRLLERAVAIDPNSAEANTWYAYQLAKLNRCDDGLRYAKVAVGLEPDNVWRQQVLPRLLSCSGLRKEAALAYQRLAEKAPADVFLLRDWYLMVLGERDPASLRKLADFTCAGLWRGKPPPNVGQFCTRVRLAADAVDGRPQGLIAVLGNDYAALSQMDAGPPQQGRHPGDELFVLAVEYAEAGATAQAVKVTREAVERGSLYLPWALPYGATPLPSAVRNDPGYIALWKSTPAIAELMAKRRAGQKH